MPCTEMSWFDSSFSLAKQALNKAQKSIDRVLDIQEEENGPVTSTPGERMSHVRDIAWLPGSSTAHT